MWRKNKLLSKSDYTIASSLNSNSVLASQVNNRTVNDEEQEVFASDRSSETLSDAPRG